MKTLIKKRMKNDKKQIRPSHLTYVIEEYRHVFDDDRWNEIQRIINNWERAESKDGRVFSNLITNPETLHCFVSKGFDQEPSHTREYFSKIIFEKILTEEEFERCAFHAYSMSESNRQKRIFEKAEKIPESEYPDPIFHDSFYMNVYEFRDQFYDDGEEFPEWVHGSIKCQTLHSGDLENMVSNLFENLAGSFDDWEPDFPEKIPTYLQDAWDKFCGEYSQTYYEEDQSVVILLDKHY